MDSCQKTTYEPSVPVAAPTFASSASVTTGMISWTSFARSSSGTSRSIAATSEPIVTTAPTPRAAAGTMRRSRPGRRSATTIQRVHTIESTTKRTVPDIHSVR